MCSLTHHDATQHQDPGLTTAEHTAQHHTQHTNTTQPPFSRTPHAKQTSHSTLNKQSTQQCTAHSNPRHQLRTTQNYTRLPPTAPHVRHATRNTQTRKHRPPQPHHHTSGPTAANLGAGPSTGGRVGDGGDASARRVNTRTLAHTNTSTPHFKANTTIPTPHHTR